MFREFRNGWVLIVCASAGGIDVDRVVLVREGTDRIVLEVDSPGLGQAEGHERRRLTREALRAALSQVSDLLELDGSADRLAS